MSLRYFGHVWLLLIVIYFTVASASAVHTGDKEELLGKEYVLELREGTQLERSVFLGDRKCFSNNYLIFPGNKYF